MSGLRIGTGEYPGGAVTDLRGPTSGSDERVYRGGSWDSDAWSCRSPYRGSNRPDFSSISITPPGFDGGHSDLGFRLLREEGAAHTVPATVRPTGRIAGLVTDETCDGLIGATIIASGPALNGQVRDVRADREGQYAVLALPPGTYTVAFRLPGFSTLRHEGVEVTTGFTATLNAELPLGVCRTDLYSKRRFFFGLPVELPLTMVPLVLIRASDSGDMPGAGSTSSSGPSTA